MKEQPQEPTPQEPAMEMGDVLKSICDGFDEWCQEHGYPKNLVTTHALVVERMNREFRRISDDVARKAREEERMRYNVGFLRQWLNEDRITDPKKMVTNEEIEQVLFFNLQPV